LGFVDEVVGPHFEAEDDVGWVGVCCQNHNRSSEAHPQRHDAGQGVFATQKLVKQDQAVGADLELGPHFSERGCRGDIKFESGQKSGNFIQKGRVIFND